MCSKRNANYATEEVYISIEVRCETQPEERVAISGCAAEGAGLVGVTWVSRERAVETEKWLGDVVFLWIPSGKHTHNYGKSPFLMGKSTISIAMFNSYVCLPEGRNHCDRFEMA